MKKDYLNEKIYNKGKKILLTMGIVTIIVALTIGITLIVVGINNSKKIKDSYADETPNKEILEEDIKTKEEKIKKLEDEIKSLKREQTKVLSDGNAFTDEYYNLSDKIEDLNDEKFDLNSDLMDLEYELKKVEMGYYNSKSRIESSRSLIYIIPGVMIIFMGGMFGISFIISVFKRDILAYKVQEVMPIAKEGMEEIAPTIAKVGKEVTETMAPSYGKVAEEITKGIKKGLNKKK